MNEEILAYKIGEALAEALADYASAADTYNATFDNLKGALKGFSAEQLIGLKTAIEAALRAKGGVG